MRAELQQRLQQDLQGHSAIQPGVVLQHMDPAMWSISLADAHSLRGVHSLPYPLMSFEGVQSFGLLMGPVKVRRVWRDGGRNCAALLGRDATGYGVGEGMSRDSEENPVGNALESSTLTSTGVLSCHGGVGGCAQVAEVTTSQAMDALLHETVVQGVNGEVGTDMLWLAMVATGAGVSNATLLLTEQLVSQRVQWSRSLRETLEGVLSSRWEGDGGWSEGRLGYRECQRWRIRYSSPGAQTSVPVQDVLLEFDMAQAKFGSRLLERAMSPGDDKRGRLKPWTLPTVTAAGGHDGSMTEVNTVKVDLQHLLHGLMVRREMRAAESYEACVAEVSWRGETVDSVWKAFGQFAWCQREAEYELLGASSFGLVLDGGSGEGLGVALGHVLESRCASHLRELNERPGGSSERTGHVGPYNLSMQYPAPYLSCVGKHMDFWTVLQGQAGVMRSWVQEMLDALPRALNRSAPAAPPVQGSDGWQQRLELGWVWLEREVRRARSQAPQYSRLHRGYVIQLAAPTRSLDDAVPWWQLRRRVLGSYQPSSLSVLAVEIATGASIQEIGSVVSDVVGYGAALLEQDGIILMWGTGGATEQLAIPGRLSVRGGDLRAEESWCVVGGEAKGEHGSIGAQAGEIGVGGEVYGQGWVLVRCKA